MLMLERGLLNQREEELLAFVAHLHKAETDEACEQGNGMRAWKTAALHQLVECLPLFGAQGGQ